MRYDRPLPTSAPHRERSVDKLDIVYTKLMLGDRQEKRLGDGVRRQKERDARTEPKASGGAATRQRLRQQARLKAKQERTIAKARDKKHGKA